MAEPDLPECFDCKYGGLEHPCRTAAGQFDFDKVGAAIVARGRLFADEDPETTAERGPNPVDETDWVTDCEYEAVHDHPALLVRLALAAMRACETPQDAAYVAAGLIEDALVNHGPALIADVERLAAASAKVRYILSGVWSQGGSMDAEVWARLARAIGHAGRMSDDGRSAGSGAGTTVLSEAEAKLLMREPIAG